MLRMFKHLLLGLCIFTLVFTFFPTGSTGHAVVEGYRGTLSYGGSQAAMTSAYLGSLQGDTAQEAARDYADGTLRGQIKQFAVYTALTYGNGYIVPGKPSSTYATVDGKVIHYQSGSKYPCKSAGCDDPVYNYDTNKYWGKSDEQLTKLIEGGHCHMFCHWAASYCWAYYLEPARLLSHPHLGEYYPTVFAVTSYEELCERAKPGDMVHRFDSGSTADVNTASHSFLWLGEWEAPSGEVLEHAIANCGSGMDYNDFVIKDFPASSFSTNKGWMVTSLSDMCAYWTEKGMFAYTDRVSQELAIETPDADTDATGG